ncbi:MAG: twin-arginine translocase TatA/TatE family subunit [Actinomycetota bacterium]
MYGAIFGLGPVELIIILAVIVIFFLPALLPKIAKRAGDTFTTVKSMVNRKEDELEAENEVKGKSRSDE